MEHTTFLFDFDGVLVDSMPFWSYKMLDIVKKYTNKYPQDIIKIITPLGNRGAMTYFKEKLNATKSIDEMLFELEEYLHPKYRDNIVLKEGVFEYLSMLKKQGYGLNVLTASPHSNVDPCLKRNGVYDLFDNIWSNEDFGLTKSDVRIYGEVVKKLNVKKENIAFFDDNAEAVKTAVKAGIYTVAVYDKTSEDFCELLYETANLYIKSFKNLIKSEDKAMITTNIESLRDPFVLVEDDAYYVYGTGTKNRDWDNTTWACYKNESTKLDGEWKMTEKLVYELPKNAVKNRWAPEVHKYNGIYYMIATYYSSLTNHRGCTVLKSSSPEGPFCEITNGHITPPDIDAIDGTLYVDKKGQPWLVYVHEWTCTDDNIGRMCAAKLSVDFTHFISEPVELFRADDPIWTASQVTDGCFMYRTKKGALLMIWSNFDKDSGYCVGIARSDNGEIDGKWSQDEELLFSKKTFGDYDGGHGMIFKDRDGKMYLSVHSPNTPDSECKERTIFVPLKEENDTLVCDI